MDQPPRQEVVAASELVKAYGDHVVLEGASFSVYSGEIVAVLGASGSGKTTLLRVVAGLDPNFRGVLRLFGQDHERYFRTRRVAIVLQRYANLPWLTVLENVMEALRRSNLNEAQKRAAAREQLQSVGLDAVQDQYIGQLSGGMQQRVALSRALIQSEPLICLDEPLTALDFINRNTLQDLIRKRLRAQGKAALFVSHDVEEALYVADRVLVVRDRGIRSIDLPAKPADVDQAFKDTDIFIGYKAALRNCLTDVETSSGK